MRVRARNWFDHLSVAQRFMLGSLVILALGMAIIGTWVSRQIEDGIIHRTATTTALYVDSLIGPSAQSLVTGDALMPAESDRLDWLFADTPLGQQVIAFQIWDPQGRIVYSTVPTLVGTSAPIDDELEHALQGQVTADVGEAEGGPLLPADMAERDLIEIYSPIRDRDMGNVIAAAEFYYGINELEADLAAAQRRSWLVVGGVTLLIYLLLASFIQRISNTIRRQQHELEHQVTQLTEMVEQNRALHERVRGAAARTVALNERVLRRLSAELHDGPAQEISLALLRLDHMSALLGAQADNGGSRVTALDREFTLVEGSLRRSLDEVRAMSAGWSLPHLANLTVAQTIDHVERAHRRRTGEPLVVKTQDLPEQAPLAVKIALYRIIQEALTNAWRHAGGKDLQLEVARQGYELRVTITDAGPGFDPANLNGTGDQLGLTGMRERAESLGGRFQIGSSPRGGTRVIALLPLTDTGVGND
ncbi:MAG: sensor histidine kinase [Chloroflexota bacterium]|nr:sensor histidine kinase [Chloroflexota bacterium]